MKSENLMKIYEIFEKPLIKILSKLEIDGIKVDNGIFKKTFRKI